MKLIFTAAAALIIGCQQPIKTVSAPAVQTVHDTTYIPVFDYEMKDSMIGEMNRLKDSLFVARYKIERVKYYLKICKHNPSQVKFLIGWIDRAVK
ncbi:MAG TPA: putative peptidoglycan-binding domain-containing protein [Hanamia sp.]|nr:putative peptidoglycan-binding domain-containing protein [Hanamia sp.]